MPRRVETILLLILSAYLAACAAWNNGSSTPIITLDQPIYLTTPNGDDAIASPGSYRVEATGTGRIRLVPLAERDPLEVQTLALTHQEIISEPIAFSAPDEEEGQRFILLLPGGRALYALGSHSPVRPRGSSLSFSPDQVKSLLLNHQARQDAKARLKNCPRLPLAKDDWQYQIDGQWMTEEQAIEYLKRSEGTGK
jgi:hypothetical protein